MKNLKLQVLVSLTLISFYCQAQQDDKQIIYDYSSKTFNNTELKSGETVELIISNINPFVFNVSSEETLIVNNPVPENIFSLLTGDFAATLAGFSSTSSLGPSSISSGSSSSLCISDAYVEDLAESYDEFAKISKLYLNLVYQLKNPHLKYEDLEASLDAIGSNEKKLLNALNNVKSNYSIIISKIKSTGCVKNTSFELIKPIVSKVVTGDFESKVLNLELLKRSAEQLKAQSDKSKTLTLSVSKFKVKGDALKIKLNFTPRDQIKSFEIPIQERKIEHIVTIKNHFKISFSPGFLVTNGINDYNYSVLTEQVNDSIIKYSVIKEDETKWNYGISALVHYTWNLDNGAVGFNTGFGYLPRDKKITGLMGLTALIGEKQKFIISGGLAASFVNRLSDSLSETEEYSSAPTIKTKEKFKTGLWFGIAYRL